ncbi:tyrosine protein phosphatase [bacterium]|nr:tyrosine protein phosphatase [bacterium]
MIDLHSHILPELDDGAKTVEEALQMCRIAEADGITTIVATPHSMNGIYLNKKETVCRKVDEFNNTLKKEEININVLPGLDLHLYPELILHLKEGKILTLNNHGCYLIIEFPEVISSHIESVCFNLQVLGVIPVISHPERNYFFRKNPQVLQGFVNRGALVQVTAMSITGEFGKEAEKAVKNFLKKNLVHIIATDAHSIDRRPPLLSSAVKVAAKIVGKEQAWRMVTTIPEKIINQKRA